MSDQTFPMRYEVTVRDGAQAAIERIIGAAERLDDALLKVQRDQKTAAEGAQRAAEQAAAAEQAGAQRRQKSILDVLLAKARQADAARAAAAVEEAAERRLTDAAAQRVEAIGGTKKSIAALASAATALGADAPPAIAKLSNAFATLALLGVNPVTIGLTAATGALAAFAAISASRVDPALEGIQTGAEAARERVEALRLELESIQSGKPLEIVTAEDAFRRADEVASEKRGALWKAEARLSAAEQITAQGRVYVDEQGVAWSVETLRAEVTAAADALHAAEAAGADIQERLQREGDVIQRRIEQNIRRLEDAAEERSRIATIERDAAAERDSRDASLRGESVDPYASIAEGARAREAIQREAAMRAAQQRLFDEAPARDLFAEQAREFDDRMKTLAGESASVGYESESPLEAALRKQREAAERIQRETEDHLRAQRRSVEDHLAAVDDLRRTSYERELAAEQLRYARQLEDLDRSHQTAELAEAEHQARLAEIEGRASSVSGRRSDVDERARMLLDNPDAGVGEGAQAAMMRLQSELPNAAEIGAQATDSLADAFTRLGESATSGAGRASEAIKGFARDVVGALQKIAAQQAAVQLMSAVFGAFQSTTPGGFTQSIDGAAAQAGGWRQTGPNTWAPTGLHAEGGVSMRPAIFGEAGPEAAVPLSRGRSIPVELRGRGSERAGAVQVHVSATFHVQALDARSVGAVLAESQDTLAALTADALSKDARIRAAVKAAAGR